MIGIAFLAFLILLGVAFVIAVSAPTRDEKRRDRHIHDKYHTGYVDLGCVHCTAHDWDKWRMGTCYCPRCENIRRLERALDGGDDD